MPVANRFSGSSDIVRLTDASTAPIALAVSAKAPARMKIKTISMMLLFAAPRQNWFDTVGQFSPFGDADGHDGCNHESHP